MKFKKNILATIILATSLPVLAHQAEVSLQQDGASWYAYFDSQSIDWKNKNSILDNDPDEITFTGMASGTYSVSLIGMEWGSSSADPIQFTSITLNGVNADIHKNYFKLDYVNTINKPLTLTLDGDLQETGASYKGVIRISAVPEPETYAMFLAGLGLMGGIARRRKQK